MTYVFWGLLVILISCVIFFFVFLFAINNGNIKITPEIEETLDKIPFWPKKHASKLKFNK